MMEWANKLSEWASDAIAHPMSFVLFNVIWITGLWLGFPNQTNLFISVLTADLLFITSISARRRERKLEKETDELARVHPEIDEQRIKDEC